jgi:hypothetical protein
VNPDLGSVPPGLKSARKRNGSTSEEEALQRLQVPSREGMPPIGCSLEHELEGPAADRPSFLA